MLYLSQILKKISNKITPLNKVDTHNRIVSAITIMEDINTDNWVKGGEIVLVNTASLPSNQTALHQIIAGLVKNNACCLIVKTTNEADEIPYISANAATLLGLPVFTMSSGNTYLQIMNTVNRVIFEDDTQERLISLDLDYLLKSNHSSDKNFDYISGINGSDLYKQFVQVVQIKTLKQPQISDRVQFQFRLKQAVIILLDDIKKKIPLVYSLVENSNGITLAIFIPNKDIGEKLSKIIKSRRFMVMRNDLFIGTSDTHPTKDIHNAFIEAQFSRQMGKILNIVNRPVEYADVYFWDMVNKLNKSQGEYFYSKEMAETFNQPELVESLTAFFENNESMSKTSRALHVHPNTLRYRLNKIKNITGLDLSITDNKFKLYLALILFKTRQNENTTF